MNKLYAVYLEYANNDGDSFEETRYFAGDNLSVCKFVAGLPSQHDEKHYYDLHGVEIVVEDDRFHGKEGEKWLKPLSNNEWMDAI